MIAAKSGLFGHVTKGIYSGSPVMPHKDWLRSQVLFAKLPEINKRLRELENKLSRLEKEDSE
jgi:UDP-3-O-[3-hydroxymyristoyl] glucosamine N-acyltransferase